MAKRKGKGHKTLERAVKGAFDTKRDQLRLVPALMGAYVNGQKTLKVAGRPDFVWVRLRGATSEIAQAFNDVVGEHWDLPITVKRDEMAHDRWRVHARDIRAYEDWGGASYLPPHAMSHSFGDPNQTGGIDPVWIFKRQFMPLLPRPMVSGSMAIYLEPDFFYFEGQYHWWPGSGTTDLGGYIPTGAFNARFVTVYLDGNLRIPQFLAGPEFDFAGPWSIATDPGAYISLPDSSQGIPIAAVRLYTGSNTIGWGDIYDLRSPQQPLGTTGSFINIYDEGVLLGQADALNFVGDDIEAVMSGTVAHVILAPRLANYTRSGDALPLATITGGYWQVPDEVYSTGSLAIMINGVWQIPVTDFQEQHPASGTFVIGEQGISTGSFVAAIWGAPT